MEILRPNSLTEFRARTGEFLSRHEAEHGLLLGIARATVNPSPDAYFAFVIENEAVVAAAMRLDWRIILSRADRHGAMAVLAADAASPLLTRVLGPTASVESFAVASSRRWRPVMSQGIYDCRAVIAPAVVSGMHRLATTGDRNQLADWLQDFSREALNEQVSETNALARVDDHIAQRRSHVWEVDGEIVSVAAAVAPTPNGIRVNNVYTPPEYRERGYASALVASLTQSLLDAGYRFTFLHTDLANPISNRIYERVGYRMVGSFQVVDLEESQPRTA
jgi:predicted GNAT family acetyltransferase